MPGIKTYEPIATTTFSSASFVTFQNIDSNYEDLILQGKIYGVSGNGTGGLTVGNGTVDTSGNYSETELYGLGSSYGSQRLTNSTGLNIGRASGIGSSSSDPLFIRVEIMAYSNTSVYKTMLAQFGRAGGGIMRTVCTWRSTSSINIIRIGANINGELSLYGVRAA